MRKSPTYSRETKGVCMAMADKDYKESARLLLEEIEKMSEMVDKEESYEYE